MDLHLDLRTEDLDLADDGLGLGLEDRGLGFGLCW